MAYANSPPKIEAVVLPANHKPWREACSDGLYQSPVTKEKPGDMEDSNIPRRKRRVMRPPKFIAAPWQQRMIAHVSTQMARNFPRGNLTKASEAG